MTQTDAVPAAAFELRDDLDPRTFGGSVADKGGKMFDLALALDQGDGTINLTADQEFLITTLSSHPALVRVDVEVPEDVPYQQLNREPLNEYAASIGIDDPAGYRNKDLLIEAIDAQLAAAAEATNEEEEARAAAEAEAAAAAEAEAAAAAAAGENN